MMKFEKKIDVSMQNHIIFANIIGFINQRNLNVLHFSKKKKKKKMKAATSNIP